MEKKYIASIDQGTTSTRFVIFDAHANITGMDQVEHKQIYPKPGWVEHDPLEIKNNAFSVIKNALKKNNIKIQELSAIGITNQRETTVVWDPETGKPCCNAIVWQDTRTDVICKKLSSEKYDDFFKEKTGLPLATYFSGPKLKWLLDNIPELRTKAKNNKLFFGTIDSWIIWNLTGGIKNGIHMTDVTNASRTMLMDLNTLEWSDEILNIFDIPKNILPEIKSSSEFYGFTDKEEFGGKIPVSGCLGDQQAALFGQVCFDEGESKNTYGTGCFLLMNTGEKIIHSKHGLLTTVAYKIGNEKAKYSLEGSIAIAGSSVQWFRDNFGLIKKSADIEKLAKSVPDSAGVYFVPAFSGLFAPYWRSDARGIIAGLTHYINKNHIARAILESTAFQTKDIFEAMIKDSGINFTSLKVDGGMVVNELLMQFQADILGIPVIRPKIIETTVLGASFSAGLAAGFWKNLSEIKTNYSLKKEWLPVMENGIRDKLYAGWKKAIERSMNWV